MPTHRFPIHALCTIRGAEALQQSLPGPNQFVVCAKFKLPAPTIAESDDNIRHQRHRAPPKPPKTSTWVVLDMLEANCKHIFVRTRGYQISYLRFWQLMIIFSVFCTDSHLVFFKHPSFLPSRYQKHHFRLQPTPQVHPTVQILLALEFAIPNGELRWSSVRVKLG